MHLAEDLLGHHQPGWREEQGKQWTIPMVPQVGKPQSIKKLGWGQAWQGQNQVQVSLSLQIQRQVEAQSCRQ